MGSAASKSFILFFLGLVALISISPFAFAEVPVPDLVARVMDSTGTLSHVEASEIEGQLAAHEAKTGNQVAVLIVPSTKPEAIEQYSLRVAESWKLGRKGKDDGVLLLVAKEDRKMRIEVGYGLEGVLPDAICKRIISEIISPLFKAGHFGAGIKIGTQAIIDTINKEGSFRIKENGQPSEFPPFLTLLPFALVAVMLLAKRAGFNVGPHYGSTGFGSSSFPGSRGGFSGGGYSGGGGSFGGGGASGDW